MKRIIALAQSRGSTATTHAGALRYLRAYRWPVEPGILCLSNPLRERAQGWEPRTAGRAAWDQARRERIAGQRCADLHLTTRDVEEHALRLTAVAVAEAYHARCGDLYQSRHARVVYGSTPGTGSHWEEYTRGKRYYREYKLAGVVADGRRLTLIPTRGQEISIPLPRRVTGLDHPGLLPGDLYAAPINRQSVRRIGPDGKTRGVALRLPAPHLRNAARYWEHGQSVVECLTEHEHKMALLDQQIARDWDSAIALRANAELAAVARRAEARAARRDRLLARISASIRVSREDARATGACAAGIAAWCQHAGISPDVASLPAREIVRLGERTGERRAIAAALVAVRRAVDAVQVKA